MVKLRRSHFRNKSITNTFTCQMGKMIPVACFETLPGDTWKFSLLDALNMIPMLAPQYTDIAVSFMAFYVPTRTVWDDFDKFRTGGEDNLDTTVAPYALFSHANNNVGFSTLSDYLGINPLTFYTRDNQGVLQPNDKVVKASILPFRVYNKIWNEWLRAQDIQTEVTTSTASGYDTTTNTGLLNRRWNRDYFTSAFVSQQKGLPAYIPVALSGAVVGNGKPTGYMVNADGTGDTYYSYGGTNNTESTFQFAKLSNSDIPAIGNGTQSGTYKADKYVGVTTDPTKSGLKIHETNTGVQIKATDVALSFVMQKLGERLMLGGSRMPEWLKNMFGVKSSDARLDYAEYLGGFSSDVHVSPIMQTSSTDATSPQGNQAGIAYHINGTPRFKKYCEEDGFIMILMSIRPRTAYCQGLHKMFQRWTRYDYANPMFAHLSLDVIKESEIYLQGVSQGTNATNWDDPTLADNQVFGRKPMFQEYRSWPNTIHGDFLNTRQFWHMARIFDTAPSLNSEFIECKPTRRPFALTDAQKVNLDASISDVVQGQVKIDFDLWRCLPKIGTPKY